MKKNEEARPYLAGAPMHNLLEDETELAALLAELAAQVENQDNYATDAPIFAVREEVLVYGVDSEYTDLGHWFYEHDREAGPLTGAELARVETMEKENDPAIKNYDYVGYVTRWEFVTACFTEAGCKRYIKANGHNHRGRLEVYAYAAYRNPEWRLMLSMLKALNKRVTEAVEKAGREGDQEEKKA